jgi:hypothetical protein
MRILYVWLDRRNARSCARRFSLRRLQVEIAGDFDPVHVVHSCLGIARGRLGERPSDPVWRSRLQLPRFHETGSVGRAMSTESGTARFGFLLLYPHGLARLVTGLATYSYVPKTKSFLTCLTTQDGWGVASTGIISTYFRDIPSLSWAMEADLSSRQTTWKKSKTFSSSWRCGLSSSTASACFHRWNMMTEP